MKLEIRNGRVIDPRSGFDQISDVFCAAGRVVAIGDAPAGWHAAQVIDASAMIVAPGLVDAAIRVGDPTANSGIHLESELRAAVAGGVSAAACMPDCDPALDEPGLVEMLRLRSQRINLARLYPIGALTLGLRGESLAELGALHDAGCVAFSQAEVGIASHRVLLRAMQYAATLGYSVWLRPQDLWLAQGGVMHDGEVATRLGLPGIPALAETMAVDALIALAASAGCALHLCRISCAASIARIVQAKKAGQPITCDVSAAHLHLTDIDIGYFDTQLHVRPPLRSTSDRDALRAGLASGAIDAVVSDHSPVPDDAKQMPFAESAPGMSGVEHLLSLTLKWAREDRVPLADALARITSMPAQLLGVPGGSLSVGGPADLCVFDADAFRVVRKQTMQSAGKNCAFIGYELPGVVRTTIVGGRVVFENAERR